MPSGLFSHQPKIDKKNLKMWKINTHLDDICYKGFLLTLIRFTSSIKLDKKKVVTIFLTTM